MFSAANTSDARGFDVALQPFDLPLRARQLLLRGRSDGLRLVASALGLDNSLTPRLERNARRLAARLELAHLVGDLRRAHGERLGLMPVEFLLLLAAVDVQLACMCASSRTVDARLSASACSMRSRDRSASTSLTRAAAPPSRSRASARRVRAISMVCASSR